MLQHQRLGFSLGIVFELGFWCELMLLRIRTVPDQCLVRAQALNEIPRERAEWILWLDMDLLINNMTFTLPLDKYEGKDLIMHGQAELILKGEARKGAPSWPALGIIPMTLTPVLFQTQLGVFPCTG